MRSLEVLIILIHQGIPLIIIWNPKNFWIFPLIMENIHGSIKELEKSTSKKGYITS